MPAPGSTLIGGAIALGLIGFTWWFGGVLDAKDEAFARTDGDQLFVPEMRGETTRKGAGGGGCAKAGRLGESHSQTTRPLIAPQEQGRH